MKKIAKLKLTLANMSADAAYRFQPSSDLVESIVHPNQLRRFFVLFVCLFSFLIEHGKPNQPKTVDPNRTRPSKGEQRSCPVTDSLNYDR